ncbi:hypothetical protein DFH09DRAFT_1068962 [Mycena vulgaris]|nr:hypothetical protein DFH09DRAFT_1068962 [Mycena vulgaris]
MMEGENSEGLTQSYVVNGTKRKLDWLTGDVAVDSVAAEPVSKQPDSSDPPHAEEHPADCWVTINAEIRKRNIPLDVATTAKATRSTLNLGSLNIAGRDSASPANRSNHKFKFLKHTVDEQSLGVLAMQETHMDDAGATQLHNNYSSWFKIIHSADSLAPTTTADVAFLLNRKFIDVEHTQIFELVPGRALMINVPWHKGQTLTILNIYAPNTPQERDELWTELWSKWRDDRGWRIDQTAVKTDHSLIATQIVCRENVKPGRGRFSLPLYLLKTRKFTRKIHRMAKNLKAEAEVLSHTPRRNDHNIQTLWAQCKRDTIEHAKKCSLLVETEDIRKLRTWKAQLLLVIHDMDMPVEDCNLTAYMLEKKINDTLRERAQEKQDLSQTQYDVEGETLHSRFWM